MKKIALIGSTGSIGKQTLSVVRRHPDKFKIVHDRHIPIEGAHAEGPHCRLRHSRPPAALCPAAERATPVR